MLLIVVIQPAFAEDDLYVDSDKWTTEYDDIFSKYSKRYFGPFFDWRWFKAQAIAESRLRPQVVSPRGALGIMQIMPTTFAEIKEENPHFSEISQPKWNIAAGIYYDRKLFRKWELPSDDDRLMLAFASYNAGYWRVRKKAVHITNVEDITWNKLEKNVPSETRAYVAYIRDLMNADENERTNRRRLRGVAKLLLGNS